MSTCQIIAAPSAKNNAMPANILNLPAYTIASIEQNEHDYHINAEVKTAPTRCEHCFSNVLVGYGRREQLVKDLPMHGRRVGIYVSTRRFKCQSCQKTFSEELPEAVKNGPGAYRVRRNRLLRSAVLDRLNAPDLPKIRADLFSAFP